MSSTRPRTVSHVDNDTERARRMIGGVTRQTIIALEAGRYAPSLLLAFRIGRVFDASVEQVFQYDF